VANTSSTLLTLEEFRAAYGNAHGYEYWFGEALRKGLPTSLHGITQFILMMFFRAAGFRAASEVELRIDPDWEPRPDVVISSSPLEQPYPTRAESLTAVIEVLSEDDPLPMLFKKCRNYVRIGIPRIFLVDPESRNAWEWSVQTENIERISVFYLPEGNFAVDSVWEELDKELP
jgi:Uma2 family endonuclease